ncbi:hypothetical protein [Mesobacillus subterraneus]|uniref:Uncharacterized protein n=1 Tax=Mesobacillus subterraneus TaxID=285983 RepID=A0A427TTC6_9BACI|nr:hypothetical protein [Mesobacillus subterraneus]RSD27615.1 hypothetical protein EJA10_07475 [Mesobacillus subterraneus]
MNYKQLLPEFMFPVLDEIINRGEPISPNLTPIYRATKKKYTLGVNDFKCQIEEDRGKTFDAGEFACSVNFDEDGKNNLASKLESIKGLRKNNPFVARGFLRSNSGLIEIDGDNHVNWWIFKNEKSSIPNDFQHYLDVKSFIEEKEVNNEYK